MRQEKRDRAEDGKEVEDVPLDGYGGPWKEGQNDALPFGQSVPRWISCRKRARGG